VPCEEKEQREGSLRDMLEAPVDKDDASGLLISVE
jgi:hypothetical protein